MKNCKSNRAALGEVIHRGRFDVNSDGRSRSLSCKAGLLAPNPGRALCFPAAPMTEWHILLNCLRFRESFLKPLVSIGG